MTMADKTDIQTTLKERFMELPRVVQNAITSADVRKRMRELADIHKLHIDQWETLENEVMMTLFGVLPIEELECELEHPDAKATGVSDVEAARTQILGSEDKPAAPVAPAVLPATPPAEPPTGKIARAPVSESYKAGETSTARKSVHDDPYREPPA